MEFSQENYSALNSRDKDLFFIIYKCLLRSPFRRTLKTFVQEINDNKVLERRVDWQGYQHDRTIEDLSQQFPLLQSDYLSELCSRVSIALQTPSSVNSASLFALYGRHEYDHNLRQLCHYILRKCGIPVRNSRLSANIVNRLRGREVSGSLNRHFVTSPNIYSAIQWQRRTLGHLSAVYCLLFDRNGKYIITGADDLLIKIWQAQTGRLITTFRGASSEITDISINSLNTLLAAGSMDRILRIWDLQTGAPVAVLTGHTGMITSVNFCPSPSRDLHYLVTTSNDGSVAFWSYSVALDGKVTASTKPTVYQEKLRPGQAQMLCSSFSPGGVFLATGSADHHVRVYYMKSDDGPYRLLETEAHTDRVDSIQWAHSGLRFISGGKDATAIIWTFECQQWKSLYLHMTTKLNDSERNGNADDIKKLKVTMVAWERSDEYVITAVGDYSLKMWNSHTGKLERVLLGHTDEIYVLEPHPYDYGTIVSAGHDGQLFIWNLYKGEVVTKYLNTIEGQGYGAIFDLKWSPDGTSIAASDSHGNLLIFGFGRGSPLFEKLPIEMFFHTDYRPLTRDENNFVLDEQTQLAPHLMPPPFLVDVDGNPYPPMLQRLVRGREHCKAEQLVPTMVIGNEGTQEIIQTIYDNYNAGGSGYPAATSSQEDNDIRSNHSLNGRRLRDAEGIRNSTGNWQGELPIQWNTYTLIQPLKIAEEKRIIEEIEYLEKMELQEYDRQMQQRAHMISTSTASDQIRTIERRRNASNVKARSNRRAQWENTQMLVDQSSSESAEESCVSSSSSDWMTSYENTNAANNSKRTKRRKVQYEDSDEQSEIDSSEQQTTYSRSRQVKRARVRKSTSQSDSDSTKKVFGGKDVRNSTSTRPGLSSSHHSNFSKTKLSLASSSMGPFGQNKNADNMESVQCDIDGKSINSGSSQNIDEMFQKTSEWLTEVKPKKAPYFPQIGDELVYFPQGHQYYVGIVQNKEVYDVNPKTLPWNRFKFRGHEFTKVMEICYEIKPPRICCLKLALLDDEGRLTGKTFHVRYHDMADVLDFFVLKQHFETAISRQWNIGDRFRCLIDDGWWIGTVLSISTASEEYSYSPYLCYEIKWDNGELERMSPWDMEPLHIDGDMASTSTECSEPLPVMEDELQSILYQPTDNDWPSNDRETCTKFILSGLSRVMELAIAEPFLVPVDLSIYPSYALIVEYPIDLSTIRARFENFFYRRVAAAQFDIRYLQINAEKFNERHSIIVKHAKILTELCLRIVKQCSMNVDVTALYHQIMDSYDSSDTDVDVEILPSTNRMVRSLPNRQLRHAKDWKIQAKTLLGAMWDCEDSAPFRQPVNCLKYPDYLKIVENPMDLSIVKGKILNNEYETPNDFRADMRLIFKNSRTYNTNKRSRIYVMTVRLAAIFEDHMNKIINNWNNAKRRNIKQTKKHSNSESVSDKYSGSSNSSFSVSGDDSEEDNCQSEIEDHKFVKNSRASKRHTKESLDLPLKQLRSTRNHCTSTNTKEPEKLHKLFNQKRKTCNSEDVSGSSSEASSSESSQESSHSFSHDESNGSNSSKEANKSSTSVSSNSETDNNKPLRKQNMRRMIRRTNRQIKRKKVCLSSEEDCEQDSAESDNTENTSTQNSISRKSTETSVSSRGRIRKMTARAIEFFS